MKKESPYYKFALGSQRIVIINLMSRSWRITTGAQLVELEGALHDENKQKRILAVIKPLLAKLKDESNKSFALVQILLPEEPILSSKTEAALKNLLEGEFQELTKLPLLQARFMFS